ncbi:MAG: hypothetical protein ACRD10_12315, partial [Terriglobia bacterium]
LGMRPRSFNQPVQDWRAIMGRKIHILAPAVLLLVSTMSCADFKYTQTSQITGGAMAGMVKAMSVFSKRLSEPTQTVTYVKAAFLRTDHADGSYQIIDLDGRRFIQVFPQKSSYSVMTFDQMRDAMAKAEQRMHEQMQQPAHGQNANVTFTPKIDIKPTGRSQTLLGQNAQEVNIDIDMEMQATGPNQAPQKGSLSATLDSWIAPSVGGYGEVANFYKRMAAEIGWTPNSGLAGEPRMRQAMAALYQAGKIPSGLPLLQVISLTAPGGSPQGAAQPQAPDTSSPSSTEAATPSGAAAKALGGMFGGFGGFGHKKKRRRQINRLTPFRPQILMAALRSWRLRRAWYLFPQTLSTPPYFRRPRAIRKCNLTWTRC